jgi:hypothetical protein
MGDEGLPKGVSTSMDWVFFRAEKLYNPEPPITAKTGLFSISKSPFNQAFQEATFLFIIIQRLRLTLIEMDVQPNPSASHFIPIDQKRTGWTSALR